MNFWGDDYSFGVGGWNYNDFSRTGGVIGAEIYGLLGRRLGTRRRIRRRMASTGAMPSAPDQVAA
jgi:hypothetical protein